MKLLARMKLAWKNYIEQIAFKTAAVLANSRFANTRAEGDSTGFIGDFVGLVVSLVFAVYMLPIVVDAVAETNYTNWTFTGASGAQTLYGLIPFVFIIGIILFFIVRLIYRAQGKI